MFHVKDRETVIPGQLVAVDIPYDSNCYSDGPHVYSLVKGMVRIDGESISVIPARGGYAPKIDDTVVGIVTDENVAGWVVEINTAYECFLRKDEVNDFRRERTPRGRGYDRGPQRGEREEKPMQRVSFNIGDVISAKIQSVDEVYNANLTRPWKLTDGLILTVNPKRIPRLIGKKQSMLNMIKEKTGCKIVTGQNGLVWVKGENILTVVEVVGKIEKEAETQGLTDRVSILLNEKMKSHSISRVDENEETGY
ncbi:MAG: KH domain-containing protein [Candidatus Altiarchaeota archaeon]